MTNSLDFTEHLEASGVEISKSTPTPSKTVAKAIADQTRSSTDLVIKEYPVLKEEEVLVQPWLNPGNFATIRISTISDPTQGPILSAKTGQPQAELNTHGT